MKKSESLRIYFNFLEEFIETRLDQYLSKGIGVFDPDSVDLPLIDPGMSPLAEFINSNGLSRDEIIILLISLAPHVNPDFFEGILERKIKNQGDFPPFGGVRGAKHRGLIPTGETVLFVLGGTDQEKRLSVKKYFSQDHIFSRLHVLFVEDVQKGGPKNSGKVVLSNEYVGLFLSGKVSRPVFSADFPAELITTELNDDDLVLPSYTRKQFDELRNWIGLHGAVIKQGKMKRWIKPGYCVLFHGPPGSGKTLAAMILGKNTNRDVYRIDLSRVVSKYIGETEKNLANLFERAKNKDWILFFDEADALFGKRTNIQDAHDKYANQEVSYFLQCIENHKGLVILSTSLKSNIDQDFIRRLRSVLEFPLPTAEKRVSIWEEALPDKEKGQDDSDNAD